MGHVDLDTVLSLARIARYIVRMQAFRVGYDHRKYINFKIQRKEFPVYSESGHRKYITFKFFKKLHVYSVTGDHKNTYYTPVYSIVGNTIRSESRINSLGHPTRS